MLTQRAKNQLVKMERKDLKKIKRAEYLKRKREARKEAGK